MDKIIADSKLKDDSPKFIDFLDCFLTGDGRYIIEDYAKQLDDAKFIYKDIEFKDNES